MIRCALQRPKGMDSACSSGRELVIFVSIQVKKAEVGGDFGLRDGAVLGGVIVVWRILSPGDRGRRLGPSYAAWCPYWLRYWL